VNGQLDYVTGDATGLSIPAHGEALERAGATFLTEAFARFGSLEPGNRISRITACQPCPGGSTGTKLLLAIEYDTPGPGLDRELFVKFSRDFTDPLRDMGRREMESEVHLAKLSRHPRFPVSVPVTYFADYHRATGTGLLITSRIAYGSGAIEPQHPKCSDYALSNPIDYYRAIFRSLARLAAAHRSGLLGEAVQAAFPFDRREALEADPIPWDAAQLRALVAGYAEFAQRCPRLLPAAITDPAFIACFEQDALRVLEHEAAIKRFLHTDEKQIALCHWNAQLDNGWFWRDGDGRLHCGLIDWGRVRQMNLAYAIWGCLAGADLSIWEQHLDELLELFAREFAAHGGHTIAPAKLKLDLQLYMATIGLRGIMIAPERILLRRPEAGRATGPADPMIRDHEEARCYLHILTIFLSQWRAQDFGASLDDMLAMQPQTAS
jgi:hypothetical protein